MPPANTSFPLPTPPSYFDYATVAKQAGITADQLRVLAEAAASDYPGDQNLAELRLLRTCKAVKDGRLTAVEAVTLALSEIAENKGRAA